MIYLDNAATTFPKPKTVYKNMMDCMTKYCANPGRGSHAMAIEGAKTIYETRELIADLFNLNDPMRVIFTSSATESLNIAIKGILKPGDHVITTSMEHNSVLRPIHALSRVGVEYTIVNCDSQGQINIEDLRKSIKPNTKMVVTTHVSNLTGTIFPINEIGTLCKEYNIIYTLDASQSAGVLEIDMVKFNISILAAPGHKGLLGPQGTGILLLQDGIDPSPIFEGGTGSLSSSLDQPDFYPDRLESGTPNLPGIVGLNFGVKYILNKGLKSIFSHEKKLLDIFFDGLSNNPKIAIYGPLDKNSRCGLISLNILGIDSAQVASDLDSKYNIAVRPGLHCAPLAHKTIGTENMGAVRFSVGPFTKKEEVLFAVKAINDMSKKL